MSDALTRRDFLGTCGTLAGGMLLAGGFAARPLAAATDVGWPKLPPVKIHVVCMGLGGAWPKPEFDAPAEVAKFQKHLESVKERLGGVEFLGGDLIPNTVMMTLLHRVVFYGTHVDDATDLAQLLGMKVVLEG